MKSVSPEKYNKNYYSIFKQPNYRRYNPSLAAKKFREIDALVNITSKDLIVDFGCGQGDMCFFLSAKYHCKVIGIDYSKDAIDLALSHLKDFKYAQKQVDITFYNLDNDHLPDLSGVKYVFLNDVVEHLYDPELSQVFKKMYSWG
ncbi:MAG TPA: class I SAM-dependent methyltransferase, partial [Patescibacteria group bacterium]